MKHQIFSKYDAKKVLYECELPDDMPREMVVRYAVEKAVGSRANLSGADLSGSNLSDCDLSGSNLSDCDLRDCDLSHANLSHANLSGSNLSDCDLRHANLSHANLSGSNLSDCDLRDCDLSGSNLSDCDLRDCDLRGSNLSHANLSGAKNDFWDILIRAPHEVAGLRAAMLGGQVDGSTYHGTCACLVGSIANIRGVSHTALGNGITPDSNRPAECWFLAIKKGDTPETNPISKLTIEWLDEFVSLQAAYAAVV